ncbi:MAG: folate-binding protein YgfZ [Trueperaceae bacterium]|nr:folate-binding protein YgfZ [Trueperaceae bacterium]
MTVVKTFKSELDAFSTLAVFPLESLFPLRVTGSDRLEFLHGQISNTVKGLKVGDFNQALMLNHKGHALAQMTVFRRQDDLFLTVEDGSGELVLQQLQRHIIFDQVKLEPMNDKISSFSLQGEKASSTLLELWGEVPVGSQFLHYPFVEAKVLVHPAKRSVEGGFDLHVLAKDAAALYRLLQEQSAEPVSQEAAETARVMAGVPRAATEGGEGVLPQEAGLEFALSYNKGCYLGQEIMARIEARGNLRRSLVGLRLSEPPQSDEIALDGKRIGKLGQVVNHPDQGYLALAVLRNDLEPGVALSVGEARAELIPLPFR